MKHDIDSLFSGYFDDILSVDQHQELETWINADPANAKRFADAVFIENRLEAELAAAEFTSSDTVSKSIDAINATGEETSGTRLKNWLIGTVAIAACLLVAAGANLWFGNSNQGLEFRTRVEFATVSQIVDAVWENGQSFQIGDRLSSETLNLKSGFGRIVFDDGVEVTLEGPVEYALVALGQTRLVSGLLTANVPPGAEGFRVETPTSEVIDLGTAFGVQVDDDGVSEVLVFDGMVDVSSKKNKVKRVEEGESIRFSTDGSVQSSEFDTTRFEKLWPISSGIAGSTGDFEFVPPWPKRLRFVRSNDAVFVATEGYAVDLSKPLHVNVSKPGSYAKESELSPLELLPGERIQSYILHYHPEESKIRRNADRIAGSISFDRPVLGLIILHEELAASSRRFGSKSAGEKHPRRQLDLTGNADGDIISLSEDRKTVSVELTSPRRTSDLIRVIVKAVE